MTSLFKKPSDPIEFVIDQWHTSGLEFDENLQTLVVKTYSNQIALHQKVIDHIKQSLLHSRPQQACPEWLRDIDSFFCSQLTVTKQNSSGISLWIAYMDVLQLLTPIVMVDHIVKMKSFNYNVIGSGIYSFSTLIFQEIYSRRNDYMRQYWSVRGLLIITRMANLFYHRKHLRRKCCLFCLCRKKPPKALNSGIFSLNV